MGKAVEFKNVTKAYGEVKAVRDLSFTIDHGKLVTLLGPSGCGKTTTLRLIAGLEMVTEGNVFIGDKEVTRISASDRDVSMVFQSYALFPHMTVIQNVSYGLGIYLGALGFGYNRELLAKKGLPVPKCWNDLLHSAYKDEIMMAYPSTSGTAYTYHQINPDETKSVWASVIDGYAFPTNLDLDSPMEGLVTENLWTLMERALTEEWPYDRFDKYLNNSVIRRIP